MSRFRITNQNWDCNAQCQFIMSDLSTSQAFRDQISTKNMSTQIKAAMKINYPTKVEFNKEEYIYLLMQLFAEMGGYASFLLGFSLLDVVTYIKNKMD